jgi:hypothetical protein
VIPREGVESLNAVVAEKRWSGLSTPVIPREGVERKNMAVPVFPLFPIPCDPERGS